MRGAQPWRTNRSAALRSKASGAEDALWSKLRDRRFGGFKFVRQAAVGNFFVDFVCRERKVVVEVDGGTHGSAAELQADAMRTSALAERGYRVVRVTNGDVVRNMQGVLDALLAVLKGDV